LIVLFFQNVLNIFRQSSRIIGCWPYVWAHCKFYSDRNHGRRKDFFPGPIVDFPGVAKKIFAVGAKVAKFHFDHSKLRKQPFLLQILWENIKFQN